MEDTYPQVLDTPVGKLSGGSGLWQWPTNDLINSGQQRKSPTVQTWLPGATMQRQVRGVFGPMLMLQRMFPQSGRRQRLGGKVAEGKKGRDGVRKGNRACLGLRDSMESCVLRGWSSAEDLVGPGGAWDSGSDSVMWPKLLMRLLGPGCKSSTGSFSIRTKSSQGKGHFSLKQASPHS